MDYRVSPVFYANYQSTAFITANKGGTRSGKTYSILQVLIIKYALQFPRMIIDIARKTKAEIKDTVLVDFLEIMDELGIYEEKRHNQTTMTYTFPNGSIIRFIGIDKAKKKRGAKRHILYINEANGITAEDWIQLSMRVGLKIFLDYNPSEEFWFDTLIIDNPDNALEYEIIHSTYLDNYDFLPAEQIRVIENLINIDDFYYKVYMLGVSAVMKGKIYNNIREITDSEYDAVFAHETFYGIDWGYEHAMVLVEVKYSNEQVWHKCLYFEQHRHVEHLLQFMNENNLSMSDDMYADPAVPSNISKLRDAGYNVHKAQKDVKDGIAFCKSIPMNICASSHKYLKQMKNYKLKQTHDGKVIDGEPLKYEDDGPDSGRYATFSKLRRIFNPMGI